MQEPKNYRIIRMTKLIGLACFAIGVFNVAFCWALLLNGLAINFTWTLLLLGGMGSLIAGVILVIHPWKDPFPMVL